MSTNLPDLSITELLRDHNLRADKKLGQNFLQDSKSLESIIAAAEINPSDSVLEIGPGLGSLTRYLAVVAGHVVAIEIDHDLISVLSEVVGTHPNVNIIEGDILKVSPTDLMGGKDYLAVANVPYYITSAIFRHLLKFEPRPQRMVMTIQKEVAERICAQPGDLSILALSVQVFGQPKIVNLIPGQAFFPTPKVDSAVLRVDIDVNPRIPSHLLDTFFRMIKAGFSQKRKTLRNSLSAGLRMTTSEAARMLENSGIDPTRRAETVSIPEWSRLTVNYFDLEHN